MFEVLFDVQNNFETVKNIQELFKLIQTNLLLGNVDISFQ